jgi:hypothetical protein
MLRTGPAARFLLSALAAGLLLPAARAGDAPIPETLVIGYEDEGKVDASDEACRAFVAETVEWEKAQMDQAVDDVCSLRKKHIAAYGAVQKSYGKLRAQLVEQTRLDGAAAVQHLAQMIKSCIDMKFALSTGGHNIGIDMIPNVIATECLDLGRDVIEREATRLSGGQTDDTKKGGE